jgi:DNA-binding NarL/FixJ family response regulator
VVATVALAVSLGLINRVDRSVTVIERQTRQIGHGLSAFVLSDFNIVLADHAVERPQVEGYLADPNSGYAPLVDAITSVMAGRRFLGNAVPLTMINEKNLIEHGRKPGEPIIRMKDIDPEKLRRALLASWKVKNSSAPENTFEKAAPEVR